MKKFTKTEAHAGVACEMEIELNVGTKEEDYAQGKSIVHDVHKLILTVYKKENLKGKKHDKGGAVPADKATAEQDRKEKIEYQRSYEFVVEPSKLLPDYVTAKARAVEEVLKKYTVEVDMENTFHKQLLDGGFKVKE